MSDEQKPENKPIKIGQHPRDWHDEQKRKQSPEYKAEQKKRFQDAMKQLDEQFGKKPEEVKKSAKLPDDLAEDHELWSYENVEDSRRRIHDSLQQKEFQNVRRQMAQDLSRETPTKYIDGKKHLLLHRRHKVDGTSVTHSSPVSYTAHQRGDTKNVLDGGNFHSAWIPEDSVAYSYKHSKKHFNSKHIRNNLHHGDEHEVIVSPGTYPVDSTYYYAEKEFDEDKSKIKNFIKKSEWTNEPMTLQKIAVAGRVLNTANQVGAAATEGGVHKEGSTAPQSSEHYSKPFASPDNARKLKSKMAKIQAAKELKEKNPKEDWDKHLINKSEGKIDIKDVRKIAMKIQSLQKAMGHKNLTRVHHPHFINSIHEHDDCRQNYHEKTSRKIDQMIINKLSEVKKHVDDPENKPSPVDLKIQGRLSTRTEPDPAHITDLLSDEDSNAKTIKNKTQGEYASKIMYLSPAGQAGVGNVCPALTPGCHSGCLDTAGMGSMVSEENPINSVHEARIKRTRHLVNHPHHALSQLDKEIEKHKKSAAKRGDTPVIRLNGTSDLAWEHYKHPEWEGKNIFERHPEVQFYDYTKRHDRVRSNKHDNYHLTYSMAETLENQKESRRLLEEGHNVAMPFGYRKNTFKEHEYETTARLPLRYWDSEVVDGDKHDLRFLDGKAEKGTRGKIIGLRAKGEAIHDNTGWVQWGHDGAPDSRPKPRPEGKKNKKQLVREGQKRIEDGTFKVKKGGKKKKEDEDEKLAASEVSKETDVKSLLKSLLSKIQK
jgi:hypothetical protein